MAPYRISVSANAYPLAHRTPLSLVVSRRSQPELKRAARRHVVVGHQVAASRLGAENREGIHFLSRVHTLDHSGGGSPGRVAPDSDDFPAALPPFALDPE